MRQAIFGGNASRLSVTNSCIVNHSVEGPELVYLFRDFAGLRDAGQIAGDDALSSRNERHRLLPSLLITRMQHNAVPLLDQELCGHLTQTIGRTGDKDTCHVFLS